MVEMKGLNPRLHVANVALSQLSYIPTFRKKYSLLRPNISIR